MSILPFILTIIVSYGIFLGLAYLLARLFFPTIHVEDHHGKEKRHHDGKKIKHLAH